MRIFSFSYILEVGLCGYSLSSSKRLVKTSIVISNPFKNSSFIYRISLLFLGNSLIIGPLRLGFLAPIILLLRRLFNKGLLLAQFLHSLLVKGPNSFKGKGIILFKEGLVKANQGRLVYFNFKIFCYS